MSKPQDLTSAVHSLETSLESKYPVELSLHFRKEYDALKVDGIFVPKGERGAGIGSKVMEEVVDFADDHGLIVLLTPSTDFGATSIARLRRFYGQFGFKRNFGGKKDFRFSEHMIRRPTAKKEAVAGLPKVDLHGKSKSEAEQIIDGLVVKGGLWEVVTGHGKGIMKALIRELQSLYDYEIVSIAPNNASFVIDFG